MLVLIYYENYREEPSGKFSLKQNLAAEIHGFVKARMATNLEM